MDTKRFKTPDYKKQVHALRGHRRPVTRLPKNKSEQILFAVGLDAWWKIVLAAAVLLLLVYLVYFAPFLKITAVRSVGADQAAAERVAEKFAEFKKQFVYGLPEQNILFFNASRFKEYLLANDFDIAAVNSIRRRSFNAIAVDLNQRVPEFNLQTKDGVFVLNSDGALGARLPEPSSQYLNVADNVDAALAPGAHFLNQHKADFLQNISKNFTFQTQSQIDHFEIPGTASDDLILFNKAGAQILFDNTADPQVSLQRLFTIWSGLNQDQRDKVAYIDLRFDPKAFLCYKSDPCAAQKQ